MLYYFLKKKKNSYCNSLSIYLSIYVHIYIVLVISSYFKYSITHSSVFIDISLLNSMSISLFDPMIWIVIINKWIKLIIVLKNTFMNILGSWKMATNLVWSDIIKKLISTWSDIIKKLISTLFLKIPKC